VEFLCEGELQAHALAFALHAERLWVVIGAMGDGRQQNEQKNCFDFTYQLKPNKEVVTTGLCARLFD